MMDAAFTEELVRRYADKIHGFAYLGRVIPLKQKNKPVWRALDNAQTPDFLVSAEVVHAI